VSVTFSPHSTGTYNETLTINSNDPDEANLLYTLNGIGNQYELDCDSANIISIGRTIQEEINPAGEIDLFEFEVQTSGTVTLYSTGSNSIYGELRGPTDCNTLIVADNTQGENNDFRIVEKVNPGLYYISLGHFDQFSGTSAYNLHIAFESDRLLTTNWDQADPYTGYYNLSESPCVANITEILPSKTRCLVGCNAVALGQLINFYYKDPRYQDNWLDVILENRTVYPRFVTTNGTDEKDCVHNGYRTIDDRSDPSEPYENSIENYSDQGADELRRFLWNIAIGLDSRFLANETSVTRYFDDWSTYWDLISFGDKLENLLIDRFRFNTEVSKSNMLNRLDEEKDYIISTLNRNEPILLIMKGVNQNNDSAGHAVIIDGYVLGSNNYLNLKINMGWGNRSSTNEILYPSHGSFDSGGYTWQEFHIYKNTTPNTDSDPIATIISPRTSYRIGRSSEWHL